MREAEHDAGGALVRTKPYMTDFAVVQRLLLRSNYRRFAALVILLAVIGVVVCFERSVWPAGAAIALIGFAAPYGRTLATMAAIRKTPLQKHEFTSEFDETEMRQTAEGELHARVKFSDFLKVRIVPEGIQIWLSPLNWVLVPRSAFIGPEALEAATLLIRRAGVDTQ